MRSIDFIRRSAAGADTAVTSVQSPLQDTAVDINGKTNAIRIRFSKPLATDQHQPTTHGLNDPDFQLHNLQVLPERPLNALPYVPGSLVLEAPDTVRFDLSRESPYARGADGWQKGRYKIFLRGNEDLAQNRQALADTAGQRARRRADRTGRRRDVGRRRLRRRLLGRFHGGRRDPAAPARTDAHARAQDRVPGAGARGPGKGDRRGEETGRHEWN